MTNYSSWEQKPIAVASLQLDLTNPRLPNGEGNGGPRTLIEELVTNEKILDLAKNIVTNGYFPTERLIVVHEEGQYVVVEGNRRLCALKLLVNPVLAPEAFRARFQSLANQIDPDVIRKVECVIAPNRLAAAPLIIARHTQVQIESWAPLMQARFYRRLLKNGITVQDLKEQYGLVSSDLRDSLMIDELYAMACSLELPETVKIKVQDQRKFPITNMQRAFASTSVKTALGVDIDQEGHVVGKIVLEEFVKGFKRLVTDIATKESFSREINDKKSIATYLQTYGQDLPDLAKRGSFTAESITKGQAASEAKKTGTLSHRKLTKRSGSLIPRGLTCGLASIRINEIYGELRRLPVARFPNATSMMLRSLLEFCITHYMDRTGQLKPFLVEQANKKGKEWSPTLTQLLNRLLQYDKTLPLTPHQRSALTRWVSGDDLLLTLEELNAFVHNNYVVPTEHDLRSNWEVIEPLLRYVLVDSPPIAMVGKKNDGLSSAKGATAKK